MRSCRDMSVPVRYHDEPQEQDQVQDSQLSTPPIQTSPLGLFSYSFRLGLKRPSRVQSPKGENPDSKLADLLPTYWCESKGV